MNFHENRYGWWCHAIIGTALSSKWSWLVADWCKPQARTPKKHVEVMRKVSVAQGGGLNYHGDPRLYDVATSFPDLWGGVAGSRGGSKVKGAFRSWLRVRSEIFSSIIHLFYEINTGKSSLFIVQSVFVRSNSHHICVILQIIDSFEQILLFPVIAAPSWIK